MSLDRFLALPTAELAREAGGGAELTAERMEQLVFLADALAADPGRMRELLSGLSPENGMAAGWLRALLLEKLGQPGEGAAELRKLWWTAEGESRAALLLASARLLLADGQTAEAWYALAESAKAGGSARLLRQVDRLLRQGAKAAPAPAKRSVRLAILSSFTADTLAPILRAQCFGAGIGLEVYTAPFNQIVQEARQPSPAMAAFNPEVILLAMDWRWLGLAEEAADPEAAVAAALEQIQQVWKACRERWNAQVLQCNFEVPLDAAYGYLSGALPGGRGRLLRTLNLELARAAGAAAGVAVVDVEQAAAEFGKREWSDPVLWHVAKQYPAPAALPALGREITATLRALYGLSAKCVALDLDGTLWGGVIGEDGLTGIELGGTASGEAFAAFQRYLSALSKSGVLLAVCSKNNEADARLPFREHPEMALKESDISFFCANWQPKDENLRSIAAALNIGTDAVVFVDDNPAERARVRQMLPEVEVIALPREPASYIAALARSRLFDKLTLTEEDRLRTTSIQDNLERERLASSAGSLDEYLAGLGIRVELMPFDEANLPRIVQLINKTNQFNVTTRRRTDAEIRAVMAAGCYTQAMRVSDRFGDSGLTGVLIALPEDRTLRLDTWLMSCRVLGRRLEETMFSALLEYGRRQGFDAVRCEFLPTKKNTVAADIFERLGCGPSREFPGGRFYLRATEPAFPMPSVVDCADQTQSHILKAQT